MHTLPWGARLRGCAEGRGGGGGGADGMSRAGAGEEGAVAAAGWDNCSGGAGLHFALFRNRSTTGYVILFILSTAAAALQHASAHALRRIAVTVRRVRLTATLREVAI